MGILLVSHLGKGANIMRPSEFAAPDIEVEHRPDGSRILRSRQRSNLMRAVSGSSCSIGRSTRRVASSSPSATAMIGAASPMARRGGRRAPSAKRFSITRLSAERPVVILSENAIDQPC